MADRARPPIGSTGRAPPRCRIVAVTSEIWAMPRIRVDAEARMPGA
jgi:hypothetical protein